MKTSAWLAFLVSGLLLAPGGCAQRQGVTVKGSEVSRNGCTVDLRRVCEAFFNQKEFVVNGTAYDTRSFEQNSRRHEDVVLPFNYPNGDPIALVHCQYDAADHKVAEARLAEGPPIDDKAVEYIRSQGLCQEQSPDYDQKLNEAASRSPTMPQ